jgi:menaquinone-specific isochorismate synthase
VSRLVARTRRLDADVDLVAVAGAEGWVFAREGVGLAGRGEALRIPLPRGAARAHADAVVADALAGIETDDEVGLPGCGPVALGAVPFAAGTSGSMVVPALVVGRAADGTRWVTTIEGGTEAAPPIPEGAPAPAGAPPTTFTVTPARAPERWCDAVAAARDAIRAGRLDKAVLAREVVVEADRPHDAVTLLTRLRTAYPSCHLFSVDGLVGASPELLVARAGDLVRSHPMAGTAPRSGDPTTDARLAASLLSSAKDQAEHRITIDAVHDALLPFCSYLDVEAEPSIVAVANVQHLASLVSGRLSSPPASALALALVLHPTPAVCGSPRATALEVIDEVEELDRGRYAGAVGWVDGRGDGTFAVAIRCAELDGPRARLFAGVGVVADSDPAAELAETQAKLQALLASIVRP